MTHLTSAPLAPIIFDLTAEEGNILLVVGGEHWLNGNVVSAGRVGPVPAAWGGCREVGVGAAGVKHAEPSTTHLLDGMDGAAKESKQNVESIKLFAATYILWSSDLFKPPTGHKSLRKWEMLWFLPCYCSIGVNVKES